MLIIGAFKYSIELEEALGELENNGISRKHILAVPMNTYVGTSIDFISESHDFYSKGIEVGMACATACSVIGTSMGFVLRWGPIIWGLTAAFIGFIIGFGLYFFFYKSAHRNLSKELPEATIIVQCSEEHSNLVMEIMWKYDVLTIGQVS
ncbi:hypothetical protein HNQ80_000591 [Anaerosolibacter carboniphilus]|uniref:Uncharacterized protein n=1 Tax=Anaerosolibacter carboniphilus TaxID=1417629 RepID=A0A841KMM2_9FIRM|nr:hypothetical protein [Anaerosolibacter carboniphilus]MBB6214511.1 hypothetical protein [Anaerosolibacter carboniphilus]